MAPTPDGVRAALDATVAAGGRHVSVWLWHLQVLGGAGGPAAGASVVGDAGLEVSVLEWAIDWAGADAAAAAAEAGRFRDAAAATGARRVLATTMDPGPPAAIAARQLGALVEEVGKAGAMVCLEYLPWSGIPSLASAWHLVEPLGPGAGLTLDTWHWYRQPGGPDHALLETIPGERLGFVQLCDAAPEAAADLVEETMQARRLPGEGAVDFVAFFASIARAGGEPVLAMEVFNPGLVGALGAEGAARAMLDAGRAVLPG